MHNKKRKVATAKEQATPRPAFGLQRSDWRLIVLVVSIKALLLFFAGQSFQVFQNQRIVGLRGWLQIWNRWDALNYQKLAQQGYSATGETAPLLVFFPLYPWTVRLFAFIVHDYLVSAFIVSAIASIAATILLKRLVEVDYSPELSRRAVWFLLIFPTSYFLHIGYTESFFLMLVVGCLLAARKQHWMLAGILGALSCLTRPNGLVLVPALLVEAGQQYWSTRRWQRQWLWIGVVALGFGGYLLLNKSVTGDAFAFVTIQHQHFSKSLAWPWTGIRSTFDAMGRPPSEAVMIGVQELFFIVLAFACTVISWIKLRPVYSVWMTGNWLLMVCVSFVLSVPRYTLTMFPVYILFSMLAARRIWMALITVWSLLYLSLFAIIFARGHWAF